VVRRARPLEAFGELMPRAWNVLDDVLLHIVIVLLVPFAILVLGLPVSPAWWSCWARCSRRSLVGVC